MPSSGAPELRCSGCNAPVDRYEEGRCAFCRMADRGDDQLLSHDSRGWIDRIAKVRHRNQASLKQGTSPQTWTERVEHRVPCGCGCEQQARMLEEAPA
jgi:hypothetical protein